MAGERALFDDSETLHIPEGLRFECTGCGNCCLQWPVPSTADDRQRIIDLSHSMKHSGTHSGNVELPVRLFRSVDFDVIKSKSQTFQFTLEKRADGRCIFLSEKNRCALHEQFGAEAKPSMCQLFPYTFTEAPDGFYASVSFASTGALFNQGRLLSEQREHLTSRLDLFKKLFPKLKLDWSGIQLVDGISMRWSQYLLMERDILRVLAENMRDALSQDNYLWSVRLLNLSEYILSQLPAQTARTDLERKELIPNTQSSDLQFARYLMSLYLPDNVFESANDIPPVREFLEGMVSGSAQLSFKIDGQDVDLAHAFAQSLGMLERDSEHLLARYLYSRVFSKLYFGPGMGHFSLLSGYHHLVLLLVLVRLKIKCLNWLGKRPDAFQVAEIVRSLERKLTAFQHTRESSSVLEVLLESPSRFRRLVDLAL
ncbi:MAG TPA: YkgJ family cysteine cluster protein [Oculatellaceae cyanobacterium]